MEAITAHDAMGDEVGFDPTCDETWFDAKCRRDREAEDARQLAALENPKSRMRVYRFLALRFLKSDAQFRLLCRLLEYAGPDLDNAFPSRRALARELRRSVGAIDTHLARLKKLGWIKIHSFMTEEGGLQSSNGFQFCVPPGLINEEGWKGPAIFFRHDGTVPRDPDERKRRDKAIDDLIAATD